MKFLCVPCDAPMTLSETHGPFDGTMSIVYQCPECTHSMAMLTNRSETQMVKSLGVKIGGRNKSAAPMEILRNHLASPREGFDSPDPFTSGGKCPFTGVVSEAFSAANDSPQVSWTPQAKKRIEDIPEIVRAMVRQNVEEFARQNGHKVIDESVIDEVKDVLGM